MYDEIIKLVKEEGEKLSKIAGTVKDGHNEKEWTTEHDHAIEKKFYALITSFGKDHTLYSEEINNSYTASDNEWIVDPISHTINFIHGMPHYAIVVSHIHKGEVVFACVYDPSMKELFTAEKHKGAFLNGKKISVKDSEARPLILFNPYPLGSWKLDETIEIYKKFYPLGYIDALGSMGLQFAYVAAGRVQLVVMVNKDTFPLFAGKLLVEEAGGKFSDFKGDGLTVESHGVIAGTKNYYQKALDLLNQ